MVRCLMLKHFFILLLYSFTTLCLQGAVSRPSNEYNMELFSEDVAKFVQFIKDLPYDTAAPAWYQENPQIVIEEIKKECLGVFRHSSCYLTPTFGEIDNFEESDIIFGIIASLRQSNIICGYYIDMNFFVLYN